MLTLERDPAKQKRTAPTRVADERSRAERALLCTRCGHIVTMPAARIVVQGSHEHRFMNPAGELFHIGCFGEATGAGVHGDPSDEYPWFAGFFWQYAHCGGCHGQLGWFFSAGGPAFFGLVLSRLFEGPAE